jgi:CSLREA domain-containing protein
MTLGLLIAVPAVALAQDASDPTGAPSPAPPAPTIQSDKEDYYPGELVTLTGSNWQPGEIVRIVVDDDGVAEERWQRDVEVIADSDGNIRDEFNLPGWFVKDYSVTATGALSGTATTTFTDSTAFGGCPGNISNVPTNINVTTFSDDYNVGATPLTSTCSLREAIRAANSDSAADTIHLPAGTYTLDRAGADETGFESQTGDLDITRPLTIKGGEVAQETIIQAGTDNTNGIDRVLHVSSNGTLTMNDTTVRYGQINDDGGGIKTDRPLTLTDVAISDNQAGNGGGISHQGSQLLFNGVTISGNTASLDGGGLYSFGTTSGSGLLTNVTISDNSATGNGGGLRAAGANPTAQLPNLTLRHATVSHNTAPNGSNISRSTGPISLRNTIVSNPNGIDGIQGINDPKNCAGVVINTAANLDSGTSCGFGTAGGSKSNADAHLGALANNGGPTETLALLSGSAAINAGNAFFGERVDQRGVSRPQPLGGNHDIGAFEVRFFALEVQKAGTGSGTVTSNPAGIDCGSDCSENYGEGTSVSLTATADSDSTFAGWSGAGTTNPDGTRKVTMSEARSVTATFNIANSAPVAADDDYSVDEDGTLTANGETNPSGVLANDTDADSDDSLTATLVDNVDNGSLTLNGDGTFTYEPNLNFNGEDTFTYKVSDGTAESNVATVRVTVNPVDDDPVAVNDQATVLEDVGATAIDVLANDTDADGGTKTIASVTQPANGAVAITDGGSGLTYESEENYCNDDSPTEDFTYTLNSGSTATVAVTVTCVNDAPTMPDTITSDESLNNDGTFTLDWGASSDVERDDVTYTLEKRDSDDTNWTNVVSDLTSASYTFGGTNPTNPVESEGTWDYRVKAVDSPAGAQSDYSTAENLAKVDKSGPNAPTLSFNTSANQSLKVTVSGVDWYKDSALIDVAANGDKTLADTSDGSGVDAASLLPNPFDVTQNGTSTARRTVKDNATNESDAGTLEVNVDAANPTLGNCPTAGPFILNSGGGTQSVGPITASDGESGVDNATSTLSGSVNTSTVGEKTVTFKAVDHVGHEVTKECTYNVNYAFSGFLEPIKQQTGTDVSTFKAGSTVPVKIQLKDANGNAVQSASAPQWLTPQKGSATNQAVDETVFTDPDTSGNLYKWDGTQYHYNWSTKGVAGSFYYKIGVKLDDGQTYYVNISLR